MESIEIPDGVLYNDNIYHCVRRWREDERFVSKSKLVKSIEITDGVLYNDTIYHCVRLWREDELFASKPTDYSIM